MKFRSMEIFLLSDGKFALDGGAMFGVVPKVIWERLSTPDEKNRIELGLNCLLIETKGKKILIDTGIGDKFSKKIAEIYGIDKKDTLISSLKKIGVSPNNIDIVINTHLHFDHCGGNTIRTEDGKIVPTFPKAKYFIQKKEWEDAISPNERTKASYLAENFLPLLEFKQLELIEGDIEIVPGIKTLVTGGHTEGHQSILIQDGEKTAIYFGDLIPTTSHLKIPFVMGYDLYPLVTMGKKKELLKKAKEEEWLLIFEHDLKIGIVCSKDLEKPL
ncbi:MAG: MBL fold metallo-hydrolase [Candidatus Edwardsbacteria bacterium]